MIFHLLSKDSQCGDLSAFPYCVIVWTLFKDLFLIFVTTTYVKVIIPMTYILNTKHPDTNKITDKALILHPFKAWVKFTKAQIMLLVFDWHFSNKRTSTNVYLDQRLGAAHSKRWSKSSFSMFSHIFARFWCKISIFCLIIKHWSTQKCWSGTLENITICVLSLYGTLLYYYHATHYKLRNLAERPDLFM